jgi:hypothetical protein
MRMPFSLEGENGIQAWFLFLTAPQNTQGRIS